MEQALFIQHEIISQLDAVKTAEEQAKAAYDLAFDRYQKGLVDLVTVLNSQNQWRNSQSIKILIQNLHINSYFCLYCTGRKILTFENIMKKLLKSILQHQS